MLKEFTMNKEYQRCTFCIMDTSDPEIVFDNQGICNHCKRQQHLQKTRGYRKGISEIELNTIIENIKHKQKNRQYDVVVGVSGGVDSAYALHYSVKLGLRVLAVHVDAGWNSETAVSNIEKLCQKLNVDLHTIVVDWRLMKELQRSFLYSGLPNLDIPQDHVFMAAVFKFALKNRVKFMINGSNYATEGILPTSWGYDAMDYRFIKSVHKRHGRKTSIRKLPKLNFVEYLFYNFNVSRVNILNYIPYSKTSALDYLSNEYGWNYYGGKHFESRFTKFFQSYYLVKKYGFDKRIAHLSSQIVNLEIERDDALSVLASPTYVDESSLNDDLNFVLKKTEIAFEAWQKILEMKPCTEEDYKNTKKLRRLLFKIRNRFV
jgi:N-acetyl sugar amidotransferase